MQLGCNAPGIPDPPYAQNNACNTLTKRKACRYYTTYPSGYCQLSTRCADEAPAKDAGARTFAKLDAGPQQT